MMSKIQIEVCFITPQKQFLRTLQVPIGTTIQEAIIKSGVMNEFADINFTSLKTGIYGKLKTPETILREGNRVEIYRPLQFDPMVARRKRAEKKRKI